MRTAELIRYFVLVATGTTLYASGQHYTQMARQAAQGLKAFDIIRVTLLFGAAGIKDLPRHRW